jgi:O-antigen/teichoic acid export membrane protein
MFERLTRFANAEGMAGPAFIMLIATVVGGGFNFLFQVMMINLIPGAMAELGALLAILLIVTVPASAVSSVLTRYVSKYDAQGQDGVISWLIRRIFVLTAVAGFIISILLILILNVSEVHTTLHLTSTLPVILLPSPSSCH